jgi:hypothetical protein
MDPYLEAAGTWPGFHDAFLAYAREVLQPLLPARYYADLRTREEIGISGYQAERAIYSDLAVKGVESRFPSITTGGGQEPEARRPAPEHLVVAVDEPLKVSFLEIRGVNDDRLVTLVELLSPSNKIPGPDREAFERKQKEVLESGTNWVEIDLLRKGRRIGCHPRVELHCQSRGYDYVVVVSRSTRRSPLDLEVYGFTVRDPLPVVALPLVAPDPDVAFDLAQVFRRAFETGPYRKVVRYDLSPEPALPDADLAWARRLLAEHGITPQPQDADR